MRKAFSWSGNHQPTSAKPFHKGIMKPLSSQVEAILFSDYFCNLIEI
ncbi:hypothetical protein KP77_31830 [Jeotgalibacillus alimentarius]|uniref:Uncharacterized protein n=1 Tax=Jeotgalibacillus alimentarius TaxID=135826 RepID=A0A0C2V353_9BACL|nr:hypothetical protein KP77_31830 [Jeotgalibacillus alimentarius]